MPKYARTFLLFFLLVGFTLAPNWPSLNSAHADELLLALLVLVLIGWIWVASMLERIDFQVVVFMFVMGLLALLGIPYWVSWGLTQLMMWFFPQVPNPEKVAEVILARSSMVGLALWGLGLLYPPDWKGIETFPGFSWLFGKKKAASAAPQLALLYSRRKFRRSHALSPPPAGMTSDEVLELVAEIVEEDRALEIDRQENLESPANEVDITRETLFHQESKHLVFRYQRTQTMFQRWLNVHYDGEISFDDWCQGVMHESPEIRRSMFAVRGFGETSWMDLRSTIKTWLEIPPPPAEWLNSFTQQVSALPLELGPRRRIIHAIRKNPKQIYVLQHRWITCSQWGDLVLSGDIRAVPYAESNGRYWRIGAKTMDALKTALRLAKTPMSPKS